MDASAGANSFPPASLGPEICHAKVLLAMDSGRLFLGLRPSAPLPGALLASVAELVHPFLGCGDGNDGVSRHFAQLLAWVAAFGSGSLPHKLFFRLGELPTLNDLVLFGYAQFLERGNSLQDVVPSVMG